MYISGLHIIEDYFYEDYLKTRHTLRLSQDKRSIYITHKENPITLVTCKKYTPLVEAIYNQLTLDLILNQTMDDALVFFSTYLFKKYKHLFSTYYKQLNH